MRRVLVPLACLFLVFPAGLAPNAAATVTPPICISRQTFVTHTATKWLTTPGTLEGTPGDDVLVGSLGSDTIRGLGGNDVICGFPGGLSAPGGEPDVIDGDGGDDDMVGRGVLDGGSGNDYVLAFRLGSRAYGGSGADTVRADTGATADGGSGDDVVQNGNPSNAGGVALKGGSGSDTVLNYDGNPTIDCGAAYDLVYANGATDVRRCEGTTTPPR